MYPLVKRVLDFLIASVILVVLSPVLVPIAVFLRFTGEGEIFFKQTRLGHRNQEFDVWKFATMRKDSPSTGTITAKNDPRILPAGKFLRDTKINELPQLINVLLGEMSLVGPRPLTREAFDLYPADLRPLVYRAKAGVTGIGSVVFRNEETILAASEKDVQRCYEEDIMPVKAALEVWYFDNISLWTDVKIILLTVVAILKPDNVLHQAWFKNLPTI